jgi:signal transduction protein with GAF and PtsI domain
MAPYDTFMNLTGLSNFLDQQTSLDECLSELAAIAATVLDVGNCSIMLFQQGTDPFDFRLRVFAKFGPLPEVAFSEAVKVKEGIAGQVAASGQPLLVEDILSSPYCNLARRPGNSSGSFIIVPIVISEKVIGIINFSNPNSREHLGNSDLNHAGSVALLVAKSIQLIHLQNILRSRILQLALSQNTKDMVAEVMTPIIRDPGKLAKIAAKTFYREMTRAGFDSDHIISAATEIISLLNQTLKKHKKRLDTSLERV